MLIVLFWLLSLPSFRHPKFIVPAYEILPNLTIHHITPSLALSESHFWPYCSGFSIAYPLSVSPNLPPIPWSSNHFPTSYSSPVPFFLSVSRRSSSSLPFLFPLQSTRFRERCVAEGKEFGVWTVNQTDEMVKAAAMGASWILTDTPAVCKDVRQELAEDFDRAYAKHVGWGLGSYRLDWRYVRPLSFLVLL
jgi:hypothetical protein